MTAPTTQAFLDAIIARRRPHPAAGLFSALSSEQLWKLQLACAGRIGGVDPGDLAAIAAWVDAAESAVREHLHARDLALAAHPRMSINDLIDHLRGGHCPGITVSPCPASMANSIDTRPS